jgi:hypothetical protein
MGMRMTQMSRIFVEKFSNTGVIRAPFRTAPAIPSNSRHGLEVRVDRRSVIFLELDSTKISSGKNYL